MTTRYRVEYELKAHRRDAFIEWIKQLLSATFVVAAGELQRGRHNHKRISDKYAAVFRDIESLIDDQSTYDGEHVRNKMLIRVISQSSHCGDVSRLKMLVPSINQFFTQLPLEKAFHVQDIKRKISMRMLVSPSFNDVRLILNSAQAMALARTASQVELITFDGDVTLYPDGSNLEKGNPMISRLIHLLQNDKAIAIVTAAGYAEEDGRHYYSRLRGLIDAVYDSEDLTENQKNNLIIMGGEANYMFRLNTKPHLNATHLEFIDPSRWMLPEMKAWKTDAKEALLNIAEAELTSFMHLMNLPASVVRKSHGVGLVPLPGEHLLREVLEEVVLSTKRKLMNTPGIDQSIKYCAFNGGSDVWVDIGDKHLGVLSVRNFLNNISGNRTLHIGDQFASSIANDFKARMAACTVWIASPEETVEIVDELIDYMRKSEM